MIGAARHRKGSIAIAAALAALFLVGCYDAPRPPCAFLCGAGGSCPTDYQCAGDGWCKREDLSPEYVCDPAHQLDAAPIDAAPVDAAPVDAAPADASAADAVPGDATPADATTDT